VGSATGSTSTAPASRSAFSASSITPSTPPWKPNALRITPMRAPLSAPASRKRA
jgi:hypothetical protein